MKNLIEGHRYELANFQSKLEGQILQFIQKEPSAENPERLETVNDGTTTEEVLAVLIDRVKYLQDKFPCKENKATINNLEEAMMWQDKRTEDRKKRKVEGKYLV